MKLATNLKIDPLDYANQGNSFIGIRSSGKTYAAMKSAEELMDAGIPIVAIDPTGVWPNLKNGINGNPGYPIVVIGGQYADLPLSEDTIIPIIKGALEFRVSLVIDLKGIASSNKSMWIRIVTIVIETLLEFNDQYGPRHIYIEEAAEFAPQKLNPGLYTVYSRIESMARMGRNFGLGYTLINQRAEEIAKAIFEICEQVFVFRQAGKNSLKSIKDWLEYRGLQDKGITQTLSKLESGKCWVINENIEAICEILPKKTFHPDPKKRVQQLPANTQKADPSVYIMEMKAIMEKLQKKAEEAKKPAGSPKNDKIIAELQKENSWLKEIIEEQTEKMEKLRMHVINAVNVFGDEIAIIEQSEGSPKLSNVRIKMEGNTATVHANADLDEQPEPILGNIVEMATEKTDLKGNNAPMRMLRAAAMFPEGISRSRMCIIAGIRTGGSTFRNGISQLRIGELITEEGDNFRITAEGKRKAGKVEKITDMVPFWLSHIGNGSAPGRILRALDKVYPSSYTMDQLCRLSNIEPGGSTWRNGISVLRKNRLVTEVGNKSFKLSSELKS